MLMKCMMPGCDAFAAAGDVFCPDCRHLSNNTLSPMISIPLYDAYHADDPAEELAGDLAAIAGYLTAAAQADASQQEQRERVIRRQQIRLGLRERIIRKLTRQRDTCTDQIEQERARADGLEKQRKGLIRQIAALQAELDQLIDLASTNGKKTGLVTVDTSPGDYTPEYAGYNLLWAKIDPVTGRELVWRWYRAEDNGA
jgi:hypothetical protein